MIFQTINELDDDHLAVSINGINGTTTNKDNESINSNIEEHDVLDKYISAKV